MSATLPPNRTAEQIEREILRHARAILDRTPPPSGAILHNDQACHVDALAIHDVITEHGRKLSREADRIAREAAERVGDYITDCAYGGEHDTAATSHGDGMLEVLDELDRLGLTDELAGTDQLADACRRLRRAAGQR